MNQHPIIRIDEVHWCGEIFFEASILFADGRATTTFPHHTFEQCERAAYIGIACVLFEGLTPCVSLG